MLVIQHLYTSTCIFNILHCLMEAIRGKLKGFIIILLNFCRIQTLKTFTTDFVIYGQESTGKRDDPLDRGNLRKKKVEGNSFNLIFCFLCQQ